MLGPRREARQEARAADPGEIEAMALSAKIVVVTPFRQNCALIWDEATGRGAVVDPGGDVDAIEAMIGEIEIEAIVLTHGHLDHAGGAVELKERLASRGVDAPICGPHRDDAFLLDDLDAQARSLGAPGLAARPVTPDRWLEDGDRLEIAGYGFEARHCPGHSPGHVVLLAPELRFAILGDVLFQGSIGRTDFPYGDHAALLRSIETHLLPLDDATQFLCGHGPPSTIGEERRSNPFLKGLRLG